MDIVATNTGAVVTWTGPVTVSKIINKDVMEGLRGMASESIHSGVTSPPYYGLRDYETDGQIGLEPTLDEYVLKMVEVFTEFKRVLRSDGTLFLNLGDSYYGGKGASNYAFQERRTSNSIEGKQHNIKSKLGETRPLDAPQDGLKPKDMCGVPWRVALALQAPDYECKGCGETAHSIKWGRYPNGKHICPNCLKSKGVIKHPGWWLRSDIIWQKPNPMPASQNDRPSSSYEHIFLFSKSLNYYYDDEAVKVPTTSKTEQTEQSLSFGRTVNEPDRPGQSNPQHRPSRMSPKIGGNKHTKRNGNPTYSGNQYDMDQKLTRTLRDVWTIPTQKFDMEMCISCKTVYTGPGYKKLDIVIVDDDETRRCNCGEINWLSHFATFPSKIPKMAIMAGTSSHGVCSDCGAPWERELDQVDTGQTQKMPDGFATHPGDHGTIHKDGRSKGESGKPIMANITVGWKPGCGCDASVVPATVADPFGGTGTVGEMANELGRDWVIIEINPDYIPLIKARTSKTLGLPLGV